MQAGGGERRPRRSATGFFINGNDRAVLAVYGRARERKRRDLYSGRGIRREPRVGGAVQGQAGEFAK